MVQGTYFHIPYCLSKCRYCDFYSLGGSAQVPQAYVDALLRELARLRWQLPGAPDTLYFGGGTPSLLRPAQLAQLIDAAQPRAGAEITLEANPETLTPALLRGFFAAGANRLSLGVQTALDESLRRMGRPHTAAQARQALLWAQEAGFTNLSGDVMLALPGYTQKELDATLELLDSGGCTHISCYLLKLEPGTPWGKASPAHLPGEDEAADFYLACVQALGARGFAQYEISNFAKPGYESRHNLLYWNCQHYLGLGPHAHSCLGGRRFFCPQGTAQFLSGPAAYQQDGACTREDYIMLQLRLSSGLSLRALKRKWGRGFTQKQMAFLQTLCSHGLAAFDGDVLRLLPQGMLLQNSILCELI